MTVLAIFSAAGISKDMYDALMKEIDEVRNPPAGLILHAASFDDNGGVHVADVWASPDELNDFVNSRLMPAMAKHNAPAPDVQVFPVHNINAYASVDQFKV